ncbi:hypothetical protein NLI96_g5546 [Meripilus lineatus]|uniref:galacturonan 1,4-alpha-galacturonidase n=1 Tax=Meripilus lineatus TaxID=2056292 RepID=A0AAD5V2U1_9APHY|nr:hypothetical protein NLI96_g5546 [Physisporinus lineatus]
MKATLLLVIGATGARAWRTHIVSHTLDADDSPSLMTALSSANLTANATILFEKGQTYNIFTPIKFPVLTNVEVRIEGNLTYPDDISVIQNIVGSSNFPGAWFTFSGGSNVTLRGSTDPEWGWVDGHGQAWWDTNQQVNRPHGWAFSKITNGVIRDMKIWKPIGWNFATSGSTNLHAFNNKIVAVSDSDVSSVDTLQRMDLISIPSPSLSIRSLGKGGQVADVQDVLIENVVMKNSLYGARFKSWTGGNGLARKSAPNYGPNLLKNSDHPTALPGRTSPSSMFLFPYTLHKTIGIKESDHAPTPQAPTTPTLQISSSRISKGRSRIVPMSKVRALVIHAGTFFRIFPERRRKRCTIPRLFRYSVPGATGKEVAIFDLYPNTATNVVARDIFPVTETGAPVRVMCNSSTIFVIPSASTPSTYLHSLSSSVPAVTNHSLAWNSPRLAIPAFSQGCANGAQNREEGDENSGEASVSAFIPSAKTVTPEFNVNEAKLA